MIVYKITCKSNNKIYIGITQNSLEHRWKQHYYEANNGDQISVLHKAIRKYGKDNFIIEIIDRASTREELKQKEIFYIKKYNSYYLNGGGYNMTYGGDLNEHLIGEKSPVSVLTDEQRWEIIQLLSTTTLTYKDIALKLNIYTPAIEKIISSINLGKNFYQKSLHYPIRKNSRSLTRFGAQNPMGDEETAKKIILLLTTTSMTQEEIANECHCHYNTVNDINCCRRWTTLHSYTKNIRRELQLASTNEKNRDKVLQIINLLEQGYSNSYIRTTLHTTQQNIADINLCRKYTNLHNYKTNIRKHK